MVQPKPDQLDRFLRACRSREFYKLGTVDFSIFEKSQLAMNLPVDDLNKQNATEIGFSSRMHMHRDEKPISVAVYSFRSSTERFTAN